MGLSVGVCYHGYQILFMLFLVLSAVILSSFTTNTFYPSQKNWNRASQLLWEQVELPRVEELLADVGERVKESMRQQVLCSRVCGHPMAGLCRFSVAMC